MIPRSKHAAGDVSQASVPRASRSERRSTNKTYSKDMLHGCREPGASPGRSSSGRWHCWRPRRSARWRLCSRLLLPALDPAKGALLRPPMCACMTAQPTQVPQPRCGLHRAVCKAIHALCEVGQSLSWVLQCTACSALFG